MRKQRVRLCALMALMMLMTFVYTAYAGGGTVYFNTADKKTYAKMDYKATWKGWPYKDVAEATTKIITHTGSDSRYTMTSIFAYNNGSSVGSDIGYGYGDASASVTATATSFKYMGWITQYADGGSGLKNTGWIELKDGE